ncbi:MAG: glycosyltransferase family 2 protein [Bacteroidia bacterium]|nr:glycosyltransferase family 2 protein [Bacteroidia bacterium]
MIKLSIAIITYNEERDIRRCLESVQKVADEVVVVDSFSTDKTKEICEEFNVKFIEHEFEGYIGQKNYVMAQTSHQHVMSLDADEALSENLIESIQYIKKHWDGEAYYVNRLNNYCGQWINFGGWSPDRKIRLFDKDKGMWKGVNPHDRFELHSGVKSKMLKGPLLHYSYYTIEEHKKKVEQFSTLAAEAMFAKGKRSNILRALVSAGFKLFRNYIIKAGFWDGYYGWVICMLSAKETYLKYRKLTLLQNKE